MVLSFQGAITHPPKGGVVVPYGRRQKVKLYAMLHNFELKLLFQVFHRAVQENCILYKILPYYAEESYDGSVDLRQVFRELAELHLRFHVKGTPCTAQI